MYQFLMSEKLTDNQAHDLLTNARMTLAQATGETVRAETALRAAEKSLMLLSFGLLMAAEEGSDGNRAIKDQTQP
ncbi:hypothetical protein GOB04_16830 [Sinorhizobium meliloti]|nr:hypothetical protein [Sinorhizobium meliloti]